MKKINPEEIAANPIYQAVAVFGCSLAFAGIDELANVIGIWTSQPNNTWIIMTAFVLFFAIFNSILSLKTDNMNKYWSRSILSFIALIAVSVGFSTLLSGISIDEAGTFRWLFLVLTFGFLIFLVIVRLMRRIVDIAIKQDEKLRGK